MCDLVNDCKFQKLLFCLEESIKNQTNLSCNDHAYFSLCSGSLLEFLNTAQFKLALLQGKKQHIPYLRVLVL
jgi:hypothetical protein